MEKARRDKKKFEFTQGTDQFVRSTEMFEFPSILVTESKLYAG